MEATRGGGKKPNPKDVIYVAALIIIKAAMIKINGLADS